MPNVLTHSARLVAAGALAIAVPAIAGGQQPDSAAVRDSLVRDSVARVEAARADSVRRSELARIRGEPRASAGPTVAATSPVVDDREAIAKELRITGSAISGDMIADLSPRAAARDDGSRIRLRDVEGAIEATYGPRVTGLLTLTLTDDGSSRALTATDAAVIVRLPTTLTDADLIVGATAFPFGRSAQLHRHALVLPDQPLPVRVLLGAGGLRGTGIQLRTIRALGPTLLSVEVAVTDRFGARVDSLRPGEPVDQSLAGVAAGGRLGVQFGAIGSRFVLGASSISGKREQPIGCVYEGTVGPVPCPEAVNAANTRLTVLGVDASAAWADSIIVISGEWMRMVVGATDLPVFTNPRFAPFYSGVNGTYDGGYLDAGVRLPRGLAAGARTEWLQNPDVGGLNDAWFGGYLGIIPFTGTRLTACWQRRAPSARALLTMTPEDRAARDRVVVRGTVILGRHSRAGLD